MYAKFHHNIPLSSRDRAIFTFSELELGKASTDENAILQSLWIDHVNITVYAKESDISTLILNRYHSHVSSSCQSRFFQSKVQLQSWQLENGLLSEHESYTMDSSIAYLSVIVEITSFFYLH